MNQTDVYVIVPSYNEDITVLETTLQGLLTADRHYRIIVIDDGSEKDVRPQLSHLPITILRHKINLGKGAALQTARSYLLKKGTDLIAVHFDADGQHDVNSIPLLLEPILSGKLDVVLGSRFMPGAVTEYMPGFRKKVLQAGRFINGLITGMWLSDAHNGLRAFNLKAVDKIELTQSRFAYATEMISLIKKHKLKYGEVPVNIKYTEYSIRKGQRSINSINILIDLFIKKFVR
jgi:glycosyltransferase involved in cell wall biosynthesis